MKLRLSEGVFVGAAVLVMVGYALYKFIAGKEVGFNEVICISGLLMLFFSAITWGRKGGKEGIYKDEELGRRITEKSSLISYFVLIFFILAAAAADEFINGTIHIFLLILLGLSMITLPFIQFLMARRYQ